MPVVGGARQVRPMEAVKLAVLREHADEWLREFGGNVVLDDDQLQVAVGRATGILTVLTQWLPR